MPALRDRDGDIRILARHFLLRANQEYRSSTILEPGVLERLESYNWPGNIRQLENVIKRAVLISLDGSIKSSDIELILNQESVINSHLASDINSQSIAALPARSAISAPQSGHFEPAAGVAECAPSGRLYNRVRVDQAEEIVDALRRTGGNKTRAAGLLGMTTRQLRYRLEKLSIDS